MKTEPSLHAAKSALRKSARQRRASLAPDQRQRLDAEINRHLLDFAGRQQPGLVAAFMAFDGEPDLAPALRELERRGVRLAVPIVQDDPTHAGSPGGAAICYRRWSKDSDMQPNRYGILEPAGTLEIGLAEVDLALIPLVAWDDAGGRLGMGAGFYDRLFQPFAGEARPLRMGVAYGVQQVDRVPREPWDVSLHMMLTEAGCLDCRERQGTR
ncbi:MAG: 5-formyltetrahydrofolate cyclo-ligase [Lysobacterales bacterium]|nr:MAG: 5-formyltetrahydrofolate cyclo-ligase [Xanthomonadales bacterium]